MGDFPRFRVLGFGVIFRHFVIPPFRLLGSPEYRPKRPPEVRKSGNDTANTQQVRFFKLYFDF